MTEASAKPRIALTGGTGFLGSHIADTLLERGYAVRVAVRATSSLRWLEGKNLETVVTDLEDADSCAAFLAGCGGLIHCAGVVAASSEDQYQRANVKTTEALLEQCQQLWSEAASDHAFVFISSQAAHGPAGLDHPAREEEKPTPITAYGRSKLAAEQVVGRSSWNFRRCILRPPSLYGPRDKDFLPLFKAARLGITARFGTTLNGLSLVDGRDAAAAAVELLECAAADGTYFVDDGHRGYDWDELKILLEKTCGKKIRTLKVPLAFLKLAAAVIGSRRAARSPVLNPDRLRDLESCGWVCDGSLLQQTTGWSPQRPAERGFPETFNFFKEKQWL